MNVLLSFIFISFFLFSFVKRIFTWRGGMFFSIPSLSRNHWRFFPQFLTSVFPFFGVVFYPEKFFPHPSQRISIVRKAGKKFLNKCSHCFDFEDDGKKEVNMFPIYGKKPSTWQMKNSFL